MAIRPRRPITFRSPRAHVADPAEGPGATATKMAAAELAAGRRWSIWLRTAKGPAMAKENRPWRVTWAANASHDVGTDLKSGELPILTPDGEEDFAGAVVELHAYELQDPESDDPRHTYRFEIHGRAADGRALTSTDARGPIDEDLLVIEPGSAYRIGLDTIIGQLQAAFPGADVGFCPNGEDSLIPGETSAAGDLTTILLVDRPAVADTVLSNPVSVVPAETKMLSNDVRDVIAAFGRLHGAALQTPDGASERCQEVSEAFMTHCHQSGVPAELISGGKFGHDERFPYLREELLVGHFAVLIPVRESRDEWIGEVVCDWTARQFDPGAPVPQILSEEDWRYLGWRHLGPDDVAEWEARSDAMTARNEQGA